MSDVDSLQFDSLELIEIPVTVGSVKYVLREADEGAVKEFRNAQLRGVRLEDGKAVGLPDDMAGGQSLLVSRCLYRLNESDVPFPNPVPEREITGYTDAQGKRRPGWPSRIVKPLFEKVKKISEIHERADTLEELTKQRDELSERLASLEEDAAKNVPSTTTDGSD